MIRFCCTITIVLLAGKAIGQTDATPNFTNGVRIYNQLHELVSAASAGTMSETDIANMETWYQTGKVQLDSAVNIVPDSLKKVVKYFSVNLQYNYGAGLMKKGDKQAAFKILASIEDPMNGYSSENFPFEYQANKLYHIVRWSDFEQVQCMYNADLGAAYFDDNQYDKAIECIRKANDAVCLEPMEYAANSYRLMKIKTAKGESDQEMLDAAISLFSAWNTLDEIAREQLKSLVNVPSMCGDAIENILVKDPALSDNGELWARTSRLLTDEKLEERAVAFAVNAIKNGYKDKEFLLSMFPQAQNLGNKLAARLATDEYAALAERTNCTEMKTVANQYEQLDEKQLAEKYKKRADDCSKTATKIVRNEGRDAGLYIGTYVWPLFRSDWGVVSAIHSRKWMLEASYQSLDDRRDKLYDLRIRGVDGAADQRVRWDGYYTHVAISKLTGKKGGRNYSGVLFGYNLREYQPIAVDFIKNQNGDQINTNGPVEFKPKEERYILMLNSGRHSYGRLLASDFFFGFGGAWSTFTKGNTAYDNKEYSYSHPLIDGRKSARFSLMARIGVTIGLEVGSKTFEKKEKKKSHS